MTIAPKKILLVHNNPEERGRLAIMLTRFGHEVRFSCGKDCPDQLSRSNDLVIVDDILAGKSGLEFIKQISNQLYSKVIYLSSTPRFDPFLGQKNITIYEWVYKPVDPLKLAVVVCDYFVEIAAEQALAG